MATGGPGEGRVVIMTGLPGTGKTRLALALAAALGARGLEAQVLHTDQVKLALRLAHPEALAGPGYAGDRPAKLARVAPVLAAAAAHARRAGTWLVIEGTLAAALPAAAADLAVALTLPEAERATRLAAKPARARQALAQADLAPFAAALAAWQRQAALALDARDEPGALVAQLLARLEISAAAGPGA